MPQQPHRTEPAPDKDLPPVVGISGAAAMLGVTPKWVRDLYHAEILKGRRLGGPEKRPNLVFREAEVDRLRREREQHPSAAATEQPQPKQFADDDPITAFCLAILRTTPEGLSTGDVAQRYAEHASTPVPANNTVALRLKALHAAGLVTVSGAGPSLRWHRATAD